MRKRKEPHHQSPRLTRFATAAIALTLGQAALGFSDTAVAQSSSCLARTSSFATVIPIISAASPTTQWGWSSQSGGPIEQVGCFALYGNLWGLTSANGHVAMATSPTLTTQISLTNVSGTSPIIGYPEVIYGYKPFGSYLTEQSSALQFPVTVGKLPNLWLMSKYSSQITDPALPMDFSYDLWITQDYRPSETRTGDIELMIWLYHQNLTPSGMLLPKQSFTTPIWINGTLQLATFDVYAANPNLHGHTSELITFALRQTSMTVAASGGIANGTVGINLQPILAHMQQTLSTQFAWSPAIIDAQYLNGLELGEEFETDAGAAQLTWSLNRFCAVKPETGTPPTQANAASFVCP